MSQGNRKTPNSGGLRTSRVIVLLNLKEMGCPSERREGSTQQPSRQGSCLLQHQRGQFDSFPGTIQSLASHCHNVPGEAETGRSHPLSRKGMTIGSDAPPPTTTHPFILQAHTLYVHSLEINWMEKDLHFAFNPYFCTSFYTYISEPYNCILFLSKLSCWVKSK